MIVTLSAIITIAFRWLSVVDLWSVIGVLSERTKMNIYLISASALIYFMRDLRRSNRKIIRAIPYTDKLTNEEYYRMMVV